MRLIEEFFRVLRRIITQREESNFEQAREGLDNLSRMISRLSVEQLKMLGTDGIRQFFNPDKAENTEKIFCMAKIVKEDALINEAEGKKEAGISSFEFSARLFELINNKNFEDSEEVTEEINYINNKIRSLAADKNSEKASL